MNFQHQFPKDADTAFEALTSEDMCRAKWAEQGARNIEFNKTVANGKVTVSNSREVPLNAPGFAKKVLGEWNTLEHTEIWDEQGDGDGVRHGTFTIDVKGSPVTISGSMILRPEGDGSVNDVTMNIEVRVPLVGKKIADFLEKDSRATVDAEREYMVAHM